MRCLEFQPRNQAKASKSGERGCRKKSEKLIKKHYARKNEWQTMDQYLQTRCCQNISRERGRKANKGE